MATILHYTLPVGAPLTAVVNALDSLVDGPVRRPHHSVSPSALINEARRARDGLLVLEDADQFRRAAVGALASEVTLPGHRGTLVLATTAPCPCGYFGSSGRLAGSPCCCSGEARRRHDLRVAWTLERLRWGISPLAAAMGAEDRTRRALRGGVSR